MMEFKVISTVICVCSRVSQITYLLNRTIPKTPKIFTTNDLMRGQCGQGGQRGLEAWPARSSGLGVEHGAGEKAEPRGEVACPRR